VIIWRKKTPATERGSESFGVIRGAPLLENFGVHSSLDPPYHRVGFRNLYFEPAGRGAGSRMPTARLLVLSVALRFAQPYVLPC